jgi:hypothetical protein
MLLLFLYTLCSLKGDALFVLQIADFCNIPEELLFIRLLQASAGWQLLHTAIDNQQHKADIDSFRKLSDF